MIYHLRRALSPLHKQFEILPLIYAGVVTRIKREQDKANINKDGQDTFQLLTAQINFFELGHAYSIP